MTAGVLEGAGAPLPSPEGSSTLDAHSATSSAPQYGNSSAWLLLFHGDTTRLVSLPHTGGVTIGRGDDCELKLDEHRVSRQHARLTMVDGEGRLADLNSQNGTLLNDQVLVGQSLLSSGDVILLGGVTLVFHATARHARGAAFLEGGAFRLRLDTELERASRFTRPLALLELQFGPPADRAKVGLALEPALRRVDLASWTSAEHLTVLLPEADLASGKELAGRVLEALEPLHPDVRAGLAVMPEDGAEAQTLQSAARAAARSVSPGEVGLASEAYQLLRVGTKEVLLADGVMLRLYELLKRLAQSELPVLAHGETGTGKELVAATVHAQSPRAAKRLVTVNCAALQETLLESELFGHEKGAFTGATSSKEGLLEASSGGTIFLDEVGEMSAALQAKLLRALESRRITRVGGTREREVDLRVVAATHRDLEAEVKAGRFRQDLYFRLAGATVWIPPLRARRRELPMLARCFLDEASKKLGRVSPMLSAGALQALCAHAWPGNVRELKNVMDYVAATVSDDVVERWHLEERLPGQPGSPPPVAPEPARGAPTFRRLADEVGELEQRRMLEALAAHQWNQTRAAGAIDMPLRTFVTKFKQYDLQRHRRA